MRASIHPKIVLGFMCSSVTVALILACACSTGPEPREVPVPASPLPTPTPRALEFPADHSSHAAETEWWYYSGHLTSDADSEYGFHLALFRTGGDDPERTFERIQASVIDLDTGQHWQWTRDGVAGPVGSNAPDGVPLDVSVGESSVRIGNGGSHVLRSSAGTDSVSFDLSLAPSEGMMLHDAIGWLAFPLGSSYYYTFPRMRVSGTLEVPTRGREVVQGEAWYDHQWGDFVVLGWPSGWYWTGLNFHDGTSLMVSEVRDVDGGRFRLFGTYIGRDGNQRELTGATDAIEIEHLEYWTSPETDAEYPVASRVKIGTLGLDFELRPAIKEQEALAMVGSDAVASYWEGSVSAVESGTGRVIGRGYLELAGYVKPDPLSWRMERP